MKNLIFTLLLITVALNSQATVYYVDSSSTISNPTGTSWSMAYNNLQMAISAANSLDTIWVAKGTYYPGTTRNSEFEVANNYIFGGFVGNETNLSQRNIAANPTILSGDLNQNDNNNIVHTESTRSENAYTVVSINQLGNNCRLDGFIIEGGNADNSTPGRTRYGGGIYILQNSNSSFSGEVKIENCILRKNTAVYTAAIYSYNLYLGSNPLRIIINKCRIENNRAVSTIIGQFGRNGAVQHSIFNSLIINNETNNGAIFGLVGRTNLYSRAHLSLMNNTIVHNITNGQSPISGLIRFYCENGNSPVGNLCMANNIMMDDSVQYTIDRATGYNGYFEGVYLGRNLYPDSVNNGTANNVINEPNHQFYGTAGDEVNFADAQNGDYSLINCSFGVDAGTINAPAAAPAFITACYNLFSTTSSSDDLNGNTRQINTIDFGCYEKAAVVFELNFNGTDLMATSGFTNYIWKRNGTAISGAATDSYSPTQNGTYEVNAEDQYGCSYIATFNLNNLSFQQFSIAGISIYPNPVSYQLHLTGDIDQTEIYDVSGKLIIQSTKRVVNVEALAAGVYLLKAEKKGIVYQTKFIKK